MTKCKKCKKQNYLIFNCRCGNQYCLIHRLPEEHECDYDYKEYKRNILMKRNPVIKSEKIQKL